MSKVKTNCLQTHTPEVDESHMECLSGFLLAKCVIDKGKTQEEINSYLQQQIDDLKEIVISLLAQNTPTGS